VESLKNLKKFWSKKKVFVTGHTGFKGTWLCIILKFLNAKVYGFSLHPKNKSLFNQTKIKNKIESNTYGDINNIKKLRKKIRLLKPEIIIHLAAQPLVIESYKKPLQTFQTNIIGTLNLLEIIRNEKFVKSVIIITTDKVYKFNKKNLPFKETDPLGGYDPYSSSKVGAELIVDCYIKSFFQNSKLNNKISTARAGNVIGGGDYSNNRLLPDIINSINKKQKIIIRNPNHIRPWQHVVEPLIGYLILAKKQYQNKIKYRNHAWNFGPDSNSFKKVIDVVKIIKNLKNFDYKISRINKIRESQSLKLDNYKSVKKLNWLPKWDIFESINHTIKWNDEFKRGISAKKICENQILMYLNKR
jgi:CDP-glucose 4,6-dehydratase